MIITVECPSCQTTFPVDPRKVPDGGVKVRCSVCSGIFFVDKPEIEEPTPAPLAAVGAAGSEAATAADESPDAGGEGFDAAGHAGEGVDDAAAESVAVDENREHVDPWSGAGFDHPSDMGASASDEPAHPWSGGMELPEDRESDAASEPESDVSAATEAEMAVEAASEMVIETESEVVIESESTEDSWVIEQSSPVDLDEPAAVEPLETVEQQVRDAAAEHTAEVVESGEDNPWDDEGVPPAAESPVEAAWAEPTDTSVEAWEQADGAGEWAADATDEAEVMDEAADPIESPVESAWDDVEAEVMDETAEPIESPVESAWDEAADPIESPVESAWDEPVVETEPVAETEPVVDPPPTVFQFGKRDPHEKARRLARVLVSDMITYNADRHRQALANGTLHADFEEEIRKSWAEYTEQVGQEMAESTPYWFDALNDILAEGDKVF